MWKAKQSISMSDEREDYACLSVLEVLEEMRDYFWKYPDWEGIV